MVYVGNKDIICNIEGSQRISCLPSLSLSLPPSLSIRLPSASADAGNRRWVDALPWEGSAKWAAAKAEIWEVEGTRAGSVREAENLSFWEVFDAGHMVSAPLHPHNSSRSSMIYKQSRLTMLLQVPMDQPEAALDMITRFTRGKPLAGGKEAPSKLEKPLTEDGGSGMTGRPYLREQ